MWVVALGEDTSCGAFHAMVAAVGHVLIRNAGKPEVVGAEVRGSDGGTDQPTVEGAVVAQALAYLVLESQDQQEEKVIGSDACWPPFLGTGVQDT
jgi:hypothetical protein